MSIYLTRYSVDGAHFGSYLEADNRSHARDVAARRGLNERIESEVVANPVMAHKLAQHIAASRWVEAAHEATFLCFVGMASGAIGYREALSDTGLIHELLHLALWRPDHPKEDPGIVAENKADRERRIQAVVGMARDFEFRVPGHAPSYRRPDEEPEPRPAAGSGYVAAALHDASRRDRKERT